LLAVDVLNAQSLLAAFGALVEVGVLIIMFAETGLLIGFFLPGDTLLFAAGFAAAGGIPHVHPNLGLVILAAAVGALAGAQTGFWIGRRAGPVLFDRPDSKLFKRAYVDKAAVYFHRFGPGRAVVLARFIPIVRTFLNPLAGMLRMSPREFALWQVVGGLGWTVAITLLGYFLGQIGVLARNIEALIILLVAVSLVPIVIELVRNRRTPQPPAAADRDSVTGGDNATGGDRDADPDKVG
jgi:membrane-associated protein